MGSGNHIVVFFLFFGREFVERNETVVQARERIVFAFVLAPADSVSVTADLRAPTAVFEKCQRAFFHRLLFRGHTGERFSVGRGHPALAAENPVHGGRKR